MRFLVDAQLPPVLARWLREAGHEAHHVWEIDLRDSTDSSIWHYALEKQIVLLTKDEDFAERAQHSQVAPVIVWLQVGNSSNPFLRRWLMPKLPQLIEWIEQGTRVLQIS